MLARISFYGLMLALVAGFAQSADAQPGQRGGGGRGFGGGMGGGFGQQTEADLLGRGSVTEELNLSDDQTKQLREAEAEARREMAKALRSKINSILTDGQKTRFTEIVAQSQGLGLNSPMIQETLKISDEQKKKLTEIQTKNREEVRGLFSGGDRGNRGEAFEKMQDLAKETEKKMADVLTSEQKAAFDKLKENKFEGGFGGGGRGQGGNRGGDRGGRGNRDGGERGGKRPPAQEPEL